jgi:N-carbamoylputrescine amidase
MNKVKIAATQMACSEDRESNIEKAKALVEKAAARGANIVLLQELFQMMYFPQVVDYENLSLAEEEEAAEILEEMSELAKKHQVVLPIGFFEKAGNCNFNSIVIIDADGKKLGKYRKTHIPDDPGYYEKFYFSPGDTGFSVWETMYGKLGVGICWDQWFPEAARIMALGGAEFLLYPTAIGTFAVPEEDLDGEVLDFDHWQNVMLGHAAANMTPVVASNRIGVEKMGETAIRFWGASFLSDNRGNKIKECDNFTEDVILAEYDLDELRRYRKEVCVFRDRRPEKYKGLLSLDGRSQWK